MKRITCLISLALLSVTIAVGSARAAEPIVPPELEPVADTDRQWTGLAVSHSGRMFVCFPRWSDSVPFAVAEVIRGGYLRPFPDKAFNTWSEEDDPAAGLVCVQSVVVDDRDDLWILDPANPRFEGVVQGGPKLVRVDLSTDQAVQTIRLGSDVVTQDSYLNDVRVDRDAGVAYITDSGVGALIVVDLRTHQARRLLTDHPSTQSEDIDVVIDGEPWRRAGSDARPQVHADGIALSPDGQTLYFHALTARTLYAIPTSVLRDPAAGSEQIARAVRQVAKTGPADGMRCDAAGNVYVTDLENSGIVMVTPAGRVRPVVTSSALAWPDSIAIGVRGQLYVTTSQIHLADDPPSPYYIFQIDPGADRSAGKPR